MKEKIFIEEIDLEKADVEEVEVGASQEITKEFLQSKFGFNMESDFGDEFGEPDSVTITKVVFGR